MIYAHYAADGTILGYYNDDLHSSIPSPSVQLTHEQWDDCINNQGQRRVNVDTGKLENLPPAPTLERATTRALGRINNTYNTAITQITAAYPQSEIDTWTIQEAEADALLADSSASAPVIRGIAIPRSLDPVELAGRVIAKATAYKQYVSAAIGQRQAAEDAVDAILADGALSDADKIAALEALA